MTLKPSQKNRVIEWARSEEASFFIQMLEGKYLQDLDSQLTDEMLANHGLLARHHGRKQGVKDAIDYLSVLARAKVIEE